MSEDGTTRLVDKSFEDSDTSTVGEAIVEYGTTVVRKLKKRTRHITIVKGIETEEEIEEAELLSQEHDAAQMKADEVLEKCQAKLSTKGDILVQAVKNFSKSMSRRNGKNGKNGNNGKNGKHRKK